jgi:6-phosphogluconolactonase
VANSGAGHSNYTGFRLSFGDRLFHIAGSTVTLAADAAPGHVLFNGTGTKLAGTEVGPSVIDSFTVGSGGRLTAAPGSPFPAQGLGPFGSEFSPANPDQLFVSNAHNTAPDSGTVSAAFRDHRNGRLSPVNGSPLADGQIAPCWVEISHDGQFLFTVNTASGTISAYRIAANGALTLLPGSTSAGGPAAGAVDARLSPGGGFLYVDQSKTGEVAAFLVSGGNLTGLGTFPLPAGAPAGVVVS